MKTAIKNFITDALPEIIMIVFNLFLLKLFYKNLGTDIYALYQIFSQYFAYLLLAEAGFSSAALVSLYKPVADNNIDEINKKLSGIRFIYKKIGLIMLISGCFVAFIIPFTIKDNVFNNIYIYITFVLYLISNIVNYFFYTYRILYDAKQKKYIPNIVYQTGSIIKYIVEIILLLLKFNFEYILIANIVCTLFTNIFMKYYTLKKNPIINIDEKNRDMSMLKTTKDLIVHKIGGVIANNIDIILISMFKGLNYVAIYGAYNYIINEITKFTSKIGTSLYSIIGMNYYKGETKEIDKNKFIQYNSFLYFLATIICSSLVFSFNSFIYLFYGSEMLASRFVVYIFIFLLFFQIIRMSLNTYVNGCGLFKETKICTITEALINLFLSLSLIKFYGMAGILISTIISYLVADFIIKPVVLHNKLKIFMLKNFYLDFFKYILFFAFLLCLNVLFYNIKVNGYISWFVISLGIFIMNTILCLFYYKIIKREIWLNSLLKIVGGKK